MVEEIGQDLATEGYIREPIDVSKLQLQKQTFLSGLIQYGKKIIARSTANNSVGSIYSVPLGKVFFLISANAHIRTTSAVVQSANLRINGDNSQRIVDVVASSAAADVQNQNISFAIPLKFNASEFFEIESSSVANNSSAEIIGYEIDEFFVPNLI